MNSLKQENNLLKVEIATLKNRLNMQLKQNKAKNSTRKEITKKTIKKRTATRKNTPLVLNTENKLLHDILNQININNKQLSTILKILVPLDYPYEDSPNNSKINSITSSDLI